jgi:hypothetical protein
MPPRVRRDSSQLKRIVEIGQGQAQASEVETNHRLADRLHEAGDLLQQQGANPYRVAAYRRAADNVKAWPEDLGRAFERAGLDGLEAIPGVGRTLASAIAEMLLRGRWAQLERLRGEVAPEALFQSIPGVGRTLARKIAETLDVDTLEALEVAAHDGRLEGVPGIGRRRAAMVRAGLAAILARYRRHAAPSSPEPAVEMLLNVDREYRDRADSLPKIAPRRFNPDGTAWLPVLHTARGSWHLTALFSNTARAHALGRIRDWVVVFFHTDDEPEGQRTIVTETRGPLAGRRVVRGREAECRELERAGGEANGGGPDCARRR